AVVRHPGVEGRGGQRGVRGARRRAAGGGGDQGGGAGARRDHGRVPVRVHVARTLRRAAGRRRGQRCDAGAAGAAGVEPCGGGRGHRGTERHDGWPRGRDPQRAGRGGVQGRGDPLVRGEVRVGVLRSVPGGGGERAAVRGPAGLPDGPGERARSIARGAARHRGGRGHRDGEAGTRVPGRRATGQGGDGLPRLRVPRLGRVRGGEGGRCTGVAGRGSGDEGGADVDQARGRGPDRDVLGARVRAGRGAVRLTPRGAPSIFCTISPGTFRRSIGDEPESQQGG